MVVRNNHHFLCLDIFSILYYNIGIKGEKDMATLNAEHINPFLIMEIKLNRDYINNPLKHGEYPEIEDVKFLFLVLNLSREECAKICNCNPEKIKIVCQQNKFSKTKEQRAEPEVLLFFCP